MDKPPARKENIMEPSQDILHNQTTTKIPSKTQQKQSNKKYHENMGQTWPNGQIDPLTNSIRGSSASDVHRSPASPCPFR